jgi:maltooligosyltrehalose trehalohydrolase
MPTFTDRQSPSSDPNRASSARRLPVGAEPIGADRTHFRVWAPAARTVSVVTPSRQLIAELDAEQQGYFSGVGAAGVGSRYAFQLDRDERLYPDPASRYQPDGPHAASQIVDPAAFEWSDGSWNGVTLRGQVIYELHVGTFTPAGTWGDASAQLRALAELGITLIEMMPIAEFDGRFGWGYDGVDLFAPFHGYGAPDDLRRFVDAAHGLGLGVILDTVYNHLGPAGNYLRRFSPAYFTTRYGNEWGEALNFDGPDAGPVREYFVTNAGYWIDEFHFDGLRLDATQQIFDTSADHILKAIGERVRACARSRTTVVVAENEPQDARLVRSSSEGGYGLDALWNDDFHHSAMVALTGRAEAYYRDTRGDAQELISAAKYGYLFQGQHHHWQKQPRGTPALDLEPPQFVVFLQNHDQVANSARGLRGHALTSAARWRAATALMLLMPGTPMLFQGQEFAASARFVYFADFEPDLAGAVRRGRAEFLKQFPSAAAYEAVAALDDPGRTETFEGCKLDVAERVAHADVYAMHRDLLALRRSEAAFRVQRRSEIDGAVLDRDAFVLRFFTRSRADDRLLLVKLGRGITRDSIADPLVAPPAGTAWRLRWSSEDPRYGGSGVPPLWSAGVWTIPAESAIVLAPAPHGTHGGHELGQVP